MKARVGLHGCEDSTWVTLAVTTAGFLALLNLQDAVNEAAEEGQPCMPTMSVGVVEELAAVLPLAV